MNEIKRFRNLSSVKEHVIQAEDIIIGVHYVKVKIAARQELESKKRIFWCVKSGQNINNIIALSAKLEGLLLFDHSVDVCLGVKVAF